MVKYKVLSTKKLEPSLVKKAEQNDIEIIEQEFISVTLILSENKRNEVLSWAKGNNIHHVVFTSANAVEAVKNYLQGDGACLEPNWNIFCLSGRTRSALQSFINDNRILATADDGKDLAQEIIEQKVKEVVFFCGDRHRDELPTILKGSGISVYKVIVYKTTETPVVAVNEVDAVLFFSPSAVQSFFSVNQLKKDAVCFAIGQTTADSLAGFTNNKIIASEAPSQEMIMASVEFYFKHKVS